MGRLNISSSTLTSQNQGGGNSKAGLPSTIGLGPFSWRIIRRRTNYCCINGKIHATGGNDDDDITYTGFTDGIVYTLAAGSIMVGGLFTKFNNKTISPGLIKLNDDGSPDTEFNNILGTGFTINGSNTGVGSIIKDQSSNYIIGGQFDKFQDQSANHIIKLNNDGTINADFSNNVFGNGENGFTNNSSSFGVEVSSIIEDQ